jgi:hypothetical protein
LCKRGDGVEITRLSGKPWGHPLVNQYYAASGGEYNPKVIYKKIPPLLIANIIPLSMGDEFVSEFPQ